LKLDESCFWISKKENVNETRSAQPWSKAFPEFRVRKKFRQVLELGCALPLAIRGAAHERPR